MIYRKEFDGIRAIAVIAVIIYHMNTNYLPNGFLGVDIFLVISGFLITSIIQEGFKNHTFKISEFIKRRFLRIYPAYFTVIALTLLAASILLPRGSFSQIKNAAVSSLIGIPNFFYYRNIGESYFKIDSITPLLHLWSLGLELQFYLFWSLILLIAHKYRIHLVYLIITLSTLSFFTAIFFYAHPILVTPFNHEYLFDKKFVFYLLPSRLWEFGIGALACIGLKNVKPHPKKINKLLALVGLAMILFSLGFNRGPDEFSPIFALLPCIGTFLVLTYSQNTLVSKILSTRLLVAIGLISYSLYLWHFPIIEFIKYFYEPLGNVLKIITVLCFISIAILSYKMIESYYRTKRSPLGFPLYAASLASLVLCFYLYNRNEINSDFYKFTAKYPGSCFFDPDGKINNFDEKKCTIGAVGVRPNILVVGSSHTNNFVPFLSVFAKQYNFSFINITANSTAYTKEYLLKGKLKHDRARIELHNTFYNLVSNMESKFDILITCPSWAEAQPKLFAKTLKSWSRHFKMVVLINHIPVVEKFTLKRHLVQENHFAAENNTHFIEDEIKKYNNVAYVSLNQLIRECNGLDDQQHALFFDPGHLNIGGSIYLAKKVIEDEIPSVFNSSVFLTLSQSKPIA
ncbi:MAG: acyltransferase [Legionella sp.]|nr:acyltransferase [Legionella sp.]